MQTAGKDLTGRSRKICGGKSGAVFQNREKTEAGVCKENAARYAFRIGLAEHETKQEKNHFRSSFPDTFAGITAGNRCLLYTSRCV